MNPSPVRVLLVDEDERHCQPVQELIHKSIDGRGFRMDRVPCTERALELIGSKKYDLHLISCVDYKRNPAGVALLNRASRLFGGAPLAAIIGPKDGDLASKIERGLGVGVLVNEEARDRERLGALLKPAAARQTEDVIRRYSFFMDATTDPMSFIDRDLVYQAVNRAYEAAIGMPRTEIVGLTVEQLWGPQIFEERIRRRAERCLAGETVRDKAWVEFGTLGRRYLAITYYPFRPSGDSVEGMVVVSHDETDMKTADIKLHRAQRLAAVGETVTGIAHHLKNILFRMSASTKLMDDAMPTGEIERMLQIWPIFHRASEELLDIVKKMLNFSRDQEPAFSEENPNALAREVFEICTPDAEARGVKLKLCLSPHCVLLRLDKQGILDVIHNLVSNALDVFAEMTGGEIRIETAYDPRTREVLLAVADNGPGVPDEIREKIFEPFFTTKGDRGTGLGLAIARKTLEAHGGGLELASAPGETVFTMRLPAPAFEPGGAAAEI